MGEVNYARLKIRDEAKRIRQLIDGGGIYGEQVDMDDPDMVIVAAYLCGRAVAGDVYTQELKQLSDFLGVRAT